LASKVKALRIKEDPMAKTFTLFLSTSPYSYENTHTAIRIAEFALKEGYKVNLIASGDGIYCFIKNQKAAGMPNAEKKFSELIQKGLKIYL
jgi:sulfur relay (sulfurtransferase) complex TusBCD TusD component (DsrE family)